MNTVLDVPPLPSSSPAQLFNKGGRSSTMGGKCKEEGQLPSPLTPKWLKKRISKNNNTKSPGIAAKSPLTTGLKAINNQLSRISWPNLDAGSRDSVRVKRGTTKKRISAHWDDASHEYLGFETNDLSPATLACLEHGMDEDEVPAW